MKFLPVPPSKLPLIRATLENRLPNSAPILNIATLCLADRYSKNVTVTFLTYNGIIDEETLVVVVLRRQFTTEDDSQATFSAPASLSLKDTMSSAMMAAFQEAMDWTVPIAFCSVDERVANYLELREMCSRNGMLADSDLCHLYVCDPQRALQLNTNINEKVNSSGQSITVSRLSKDDAKTVVDYWNYSGKGDGALEKMEDVIENIGSAGVYVAEESGLGSNSTKQLVSWVITSHVGCLNALFTHPDHRRQGYGKMVMEAMTKFKAQDGLKPTVQIQRTNQASRDLMEQIGYIYSHPMIWVIYRPRRT